MAWFISALGDRARTFHDVVDEVVVEDELGERLVGDDKSESIMTTSHEDETRDEAMDFYINWTCHTPGFERNSNLWFAGCLNRPEWAAKIRHQLGEANLPTGDSPPNVR